MVSSKKNAVEPKDDALFIVRKDKPNQQRKESNRSNVSSETVREELYPLWITNMLFIKEIENDLKDYTKAPCKYQILNSGGDRIYIAIETTQLTDSTSPFLKGQPFTFSILDNNGIEVFVIEGQQGIRGIGATICVRRHGQIVGSVVQNNKLAALCKICPSYKILENLNGSDHPIQIVKKFRGKTCCSIFSTDEFTVQSYANKKVCLGQISRQKQAISLEENAVADTYALSFNTSDMDGKNKALLLSCLLLLVSQDIW